MSLVTADDILGKIALDTAGGVVGVVTSLHIDGTKKEIIGITIDQGLLKPDLFVGITHIAKFGVDSVFLQTMPYDAMNGKNVLSASGKELGTVIKVVLKGSVLDSVIISQQDSMFKRDKKIILAKDIDTIGEKILLKKTAKIE